MGADLDMNSYRVLNLVAPSRADEPLRYQDLSDFVGGGTVTNIPAGGSTGDHLVKLSGTNFDIGWGTEAADLTAGNNIVISGTSPATIATTTTPNFTTVNGLSISLTTATLTIPTGGSLILSGANSVTLTTTGTTTLTLPTSGTLVTTTATQTLTNKTLTSPTITGAGISGSTITTSTYNGLTISTSTGTLNQGNGSLFSLVANKTFSVLNTLTLAGTDSTVLTFQGTDTYVGRTTTDTLTNKTITSPTITGATITTSSYNGVTVTSSTGTINLGALAVLTIVAAKTLTVSNTLSLAGTDGTTLTFQGSDTYVGRTTTDTLTNKTLTSPVIATIVNTGTLTLPTSTDTLVGKATTDALTNKTYNGLTIGTTNGTIAIANGSQFNTVGAFQVTLTATGTTTLTLPTTGTLVTLAGSESLTNKTITSPALTGTVTGNNTIPLTILAQGAAVSLVGVTGSSTANWAAITGTSNQIPIINNAGTSLVFTTTSGDLTNAAGVFTIGANKVSNAKAAQMAAYTIKGNTTGSTADATDFTIGGLTNKASPGASDQILIVDVSASNALKYATVSSVSAAGSVSSFNGQTGAIVTTSVIGGRLTLVSATPRMTSTQSGKTTLYYTPYVGDVILLYDGSNMVPFTFAELSVATTDTTKNPAAIGASKMNDWFVWTDSGTLRLSHGPDWTNDTTRAAGTALVMVKGVLLNNASITNGPAASRGTYVGTTRSDASSQLNWVLGTAASGGGAALLNVWNMYNRLDCATTVSDNGAGYTYSSVTVREARASSTNIVNFVVGSTVAEDAFLGVYSSLFQSAAAGAGGFAYCGIGYDSTSTFTVSQLTQNASVSATYVSQTVNLLKEPSIGYHYISALEEADGTTLTTFDVVSSNQLFFKMRM